MYLYVFLLVFVNACSANRYDAAEAIQLAIFGDSSEETGVDFDGASDETGVDSDGASDETGVDSDGAADDGFDDDLGPDFGDSASAGDTSDSSAEGFFAEEGSYDAAEGGGEATDHGAAADVTGTEATSSQSTATRHFMPAMLVQLTTGFTTALTRTQLTTSSPTTTAPSGAGRGKSSSKTHSGHSGYSFAQLSGMSAYSAPNQKGNFYVPREYERIPRVEPCQAVKCHLSIAIVMDSSGSVGTDDYQKELSFVKTLLEILAVKAVDSKLKVCTGLVSYSTGVHVEVDPCCENSICRIVDQFHAGRLEYRAGATNTNGALKVARQMLQAAASHKKVALLITDGKSNTGGTPVPFARKMRDEDGIQIVALGVTSDVNEAELKGISGMDIVTKIDVFDEFHELASILLQANKVASTYELETSFDAMCYTDKSFYRANQCARVMTEEQKSSCEWEKWSDCVRKGRQCTETRTCKLNGIVILREDKHCKCPPCEAGKFLNVVDQNCHPCPANTYSNTDGTACINCPTDKVSGPGSSSIKSCVKGFDIVDEDGHVVTDTHEGLLLYMGGTVCDDYFNDDAANAICREMKRPYGTSSWKNGHFFSFQMSKSIKLDDVKCQSDVWASCTYKTRHNCEHSEDVYISCQGPVAEVDWSNLKQLVKIPCSETDVNATPHLTTPLRDIKHACDGNTDSFYHSEQVESWQRHSPFLTVQLEGTSRIKTVTVVNVHTGAYCKTHGAPCTDRINGAKVEILTADNAMVKECGVIWVTNFNLTAEAQTYPIDCGADGLYPVGSKVRVRLDDTNKPLEIAEIRVDGLSINEVDWSDLRELVTTPCSDTDINATPHLPTPLRDTVHACDGNTDSFYHSVHLDPADITYNPFFMIQLEGISKVKRVTVVNVHTGAYCKTHTQQCIDRIDGAIVEVLTSDDAVVEECGLILVANHVATAKAQTYPIECGTDGVYPVGSKVRVRLEHTKMPLEIAEISVAGLLIIDGSWSDFGDWSACTVGCGGGTQTRSRTCSNPAPAHGGADCQGTAEETQVCNTHTCPRDKGSETPSPTTRHKFTTVTAKDSASAVTY